MSSLQTRRRATTIKGERMMMARMVNGRNRAGTVVWMLSLVVAMVLVPQVAMPGVITGKVTAKKAKYLKDTVVYIESVPGKEFAPPEEHALIDQKGLKFIPHVLPLLAGTTVDFRNSDNVMHNVFTPDALADKFNLGSWPQNEIRSHTFTKSCEKACEAVMLCNVHPEMEAYVVVLTNPYFAVTDAEGSFTIPDVPAGTYTLKTWNERLKESSHPVTVEAEGSIEVTLEMKK
jgi:plastocyanin